MTLSVLLVPSIFGKPEENCQVNIQNSNRLKYNIVVWSLFQPTVLFGKQGTFFLKKRHCII
jgi:hypothetical protein